MKAQHYHFIGIGGIGMGTLASLLVAKGHIVSGSDLKENELIVQLRKRGALIAIGHAAENVQKPDFVVYTSAVKSDNPEMAEAELKKIPILKRAQVLAHLVNDQIGVTIAGAHGKTTTTSMVSSLLINAGLEPTTAVGGIINGQTYNAHLGKGKYFVAEVDESDGTFLYFNSHFSIITNIDFEHVDHYKNWDGIIAAFDKFIHNTDPQGCVIICNEDKKLNALASAASRPFVRYGLDPSADVYAHKITCEGFHSSFTCITKGAELGTFELSVPGRHNVLNALAMITLGLQLKIPLGIMQKTLKEFKGVNRRFHHKGTIDGIMVVDDYGHHPTEIVATLNAARSFNPKRLVTIFQPHRYSRTKFLLDEFVESLKLTDELVLTDVYAASEKSSEGVGTKALLAKLQKSLGPKVTYLKKEDILSHVNAMVRPGDLVLFLGAGDIYHCSDELVKAMQEKKVAV